MAQASWLISTPSEGTGSGKVVYSTSPYFGRKYRDTVSTFTRKSGTESTSVHVNQYGYGLYSYCNDQLAVQNSTINIPVDKNSTSTTISLKTNAKKIGIDQVDTATNTLIVSVPQTNTWTGEVSQSSGQWINHNNITNDPGANELFTSSINVTFLANPGAPRTAKLRVRVYDFDGETDPDFDPESYTEEYVQYTILIKQGGITSYQIKLGALMPDQSTSEESRNWYLVATGSPPNVETEIDGQITIKLSSGDVQPCLLKGIIKGGVNEKIYLLDEVTQDKYIQPDSNVSGEYTVNTVSGESKTDGYVCTGVSKAQ